MTKYLGPTTARGGRIKATCQAGSITVGYDYATDRDENHAAAAKALADKLGWEGEWFGAGAPDGKGNVYVCVEVSNG